MSTHPTPHHDEEKELAPVPAELPVATLRDNFANSCKSIWFHVSAPLITRNSRGAPYRPAYCLPTEVWTAICDELPDQAPTEEQHVHIGAGKGRNALSKKVLLPAWSRNQHTRITAEEGAGYDVTFVPARWWEALPDSIRSSVMERVRETRPTL